MPKGWGSTHPITQKRQKGFRMMIVSENIILTMGFFFTLLREDFGVPLEQSLICLIGNVLQLPKLSYSKNGTSFKDRNTKKKGNKAKL